MIGPAAERDAVMRKVMALYEVLAHSAVPKITVILRKAFGFGYIALGGPPVGADYVVSWANAEIGFMSAENAVAVLHHKRLRDTAREHGDAAARALRGRL